MKDNYVGTYKVRSISKGEHVIHVPHTSAGDYALYVEDDGTLTFVPLAVMHR
jgi:hypothetical protein